MATIDMTKTQAKAGKDPAPKSNKPRLIENPLHVEDSQVYVESVESRNSFDNPVQEKLRINGIDMPILPSDISFYSTNAILEEAYIRAPGAFAFRSKHSRSVLNMMVSIPVLDMGISNLYSSREAMLARKGIELITSLDAYPFCFIESHRVKSYLGSHNFENEEEIEEFGGKRKDADILMFGVQKLSITQDARIPGILLLEVDLLYNNHRVLTPEIKVNWDSDNNSFNSFINSVSAKPKARADILLNSTSSTMSSSNFKDKNLLSQVKILIPEFKNLHGFDIELAAKTDPNKTVFTKEDLRGNVSQIAPVPEEHMKFLRIPSKFSSPQFYINKTTGNYTSHNQEADPEEVAENKAEAHELHAVIWQEDRFLFTETVNPIQSIVVTKERAFASQFIGSYQHPFLQYMGRYPATLQITSTFKGSEYAKGTAPPHLFKVMLGALDSNAVNYPQGNAFNYLKIQAYGNTLLGVEHFFPKDSQIVAAASASDIEAFTCTFVENSMDKMLQSAKIKIGKRIINPRGLDVSADIIASYIVRTREYLKSGKTLEPGEEMFHKTFLDQLVYTKDVLIGKVQDIDRFTTLDKSGEQPNIKDEQ